MSEHVTWSCHIQQVPASQFHGVKARSTVCSLLRLSTEQIACVVTGSLCPKALAFADTVRLNAQSYRLNERTRTFSLFCDVPNSNQARH